MANHTQGAISGANQAQTGRASILGGALSRLSGNLSGLESTLQQLEHRLEGVLLARVQRPADPTRTATPVPDPASPVVGIINEQAERCSMLVAQIDDILDRLQA